MVTENVPAISVIIPMYNTEQYIEECLQSLLNQTLKNFEVIVVDDCSTDNSVAVVQKMFPAFDARNIKVTLATNQTNSGCPGIPRNFGIDIAQGKYICFLDSDDFFDANVLEEFYKVAEEFNADVVHVKSAFKYLEVDGKFQDEVIDLDKAEEIEKPMLETFDIAKRIEDNLASKYNGFSCIKIFRREFLIENEIKFPAITVMEDDIFSTLALVYAKNYVRIPFIGYHYRWRSDSATQKGSCAEKRFLDTIEGIYYLDTCLQKHKFFVENPTYRYLAVDCYYQVFITRFSKFIFLDSNYETGEIYDFYCKNILSLNPEKNIPMTAYLFISNSIYKLLVKQQSEEIACLKQTIAEGSFQNGN